MKYWIALWAILIPCGVFAASTDLTIGQNDIAFSPSTPTLGVTGKIYATIHNVGPVDAEGTIHFYDNENLIGTKPFSARGKGLPEDIWLTWTPTSNGTHSIRVNITVDGGDTNSGNNTTSVSVKIDKDTDGDGISDTVDDDIDGDGLTNAQEKAIGTDPYKYDTDQDGVDDYRDVYPLDPNRSKKEVIAVVSPALNAIPPKVVIIPKPISKLIPPKTVITAKAIPAPVILSDASEPVVQAIPPVQELPAVSGTVLGEATSIAPTSTPAVVIKDTSEIKNTAQPFDWSVILWIVSGLLGATAAGFAFIAWRRDQTD